MTTVTTQQQNIDFINDFIAKFQKHISAMATRYRTEPQEIINILHVVVLSDNDYNEELGNRYSRTYSLLKYELYKTFSTTLTVFDTDAVERLADELTTEEKSEFELWRQKSDLENKYFGGQLDVIIKMVDNGLTFKEIAKKMKLSVRRIEQIAKNPSEAKTEQQQDLFAA